MFPSYRNQSVDLQSKSTDWFYMMGTLAVKGLSQLYAFFYKKHFYQQCQAESG